MLSVREKMICMHTHTHANTVTLLKELLSILEELLATWRAGEGFTIWYKTSSPGGQRGHTFGTWCQPLKQASVSVEPVEARGTCQSIGQNKECVYRR